MNRTLPISKANERQALEDRARQINFRAPTETDKQIFCDCGAIRAQEQKTGTYEITHSKGCFLSQYVRRIASGHGRGANRVVVGPSAKSQAKRK